MRELRLVDRRWRDSYSVQRLGEFVARCRKRGIAVTPQRLAVIRALLASDDHPSTDDIYVAVRRRHPHVSWATVHRILKQFCEVGEARKVTLLHDADAMMATWSLITMFFASDADGFMTSRYPKWTSSSKVPPAWDSSHCCVVRWKSKLSAGGANLPGSECTNIHTMSI
jgi:Ferric uptake regulator family